MTSTSEYVNERDVFSQIIPFVPWKRKAQEALKNYNREKKRLSRTVMGKWRPAGQIRPTT